MSDPFRELHRSDTNYNFLELIISDFHHALWNNCAAAVRCPKAKIKNFQIFINLTVVFWECNWIFIETWVRGSLLDKISSLDIKIFSIGAGHDGMYEECPKTAGYAMNPSKSNDKIVNSIHFSCCSLTEMAVNLM